MPIATSQSIDLPALLRAAGIDSDRVTHFKLEVDADTVWKVNVEMVLSEAQLHEIGLVLASPRPDIRVNNFRPLSLLAEAEASIHSMGLPHATDQ